MKILALCGSLRDASYNMFALRALKALSPDDIEITIGDISGLPLFNPDLEETHIPALANLKRNLGESSGLIIASPEYAHGISGPMKNTLDWLVSGVEFPGKPIMLINTSPRASHAMQALKEVLITMSGNIVESACVSIPLLSSNLDKDGILANAELSGALKEGLMAFHHEILNKK